MRECIHITAAIARAMLVAGDSQKTLPDVPRNGVGDLLLLRLRICMAKVQIDICGKNSQLFQLLEVESHLPFVKSADEGLTELRWCDEKEAYYEFFLGVMSDARMDQSRGRKLFNSFLLH